MLYLVTNEKGGVGKTTLAVNLAVMSARAGRDTLLVDTDPQQSAIAWSAVRSEAGQAPAITSVILSGKVGHDLVKLKAKYETVIVDAGGRDSLEMRQALAVCDMAIIPIRPAQFDLWSLARMASLIAEIEERIDGRVHARAVINGASPNPSVREADEIREALAEYEDTFPLLGSMTTERIAYRKAARGGLGVIELAGALADLKAKTEIQALFDEVMP